MTIKTTIEIIKLFKAEILHGCLDFGCKQGTDLLAALKLNELIVFIGEKQPNCIFVCMNIKVKLCN